MKIIRKLFFLIAGCLFAWLSFYTYNQLTDGFSLRQMTSSLPLYPEFTVPLSEEKKEQLRNSLDQPFHYLGKGCQFYAFVSEDGKYVIKFLKQKHLRPFTWLNSIPMPKKLRKISDAKIERRKERVSKLFSSCKLAYEKMPDETGLLYIHLHRAPALEKTVTLVDKLGRKRRVEIDKYEYVVQKKATTVKEMFTQIQSDEAQMQERIDQLLTLIFSRYRKGICDRDRSFVQNVAFLPEEGRALFIDTGQFYEDPVILEKEEQCKDMRKRIGNLRHFTSKHFPELAPLVDAQINNYLRPRFLGPFRLEKEASSPNSSSSSSSSSPKEGSVNSPSNPSCEESLRREANFSDKASNVLSVSERVVPLRWAKKSSSVSNFSENVIEEAEVISGR